MRSLKKLFLCVMLIFLSSLAFSLNEDSKIYLNERRKEPAKMTIEVTKLKSKELPMNFDIENKIIYAELPQEIDENDVIFVSETLDEIPSTSTTNGRKSINNIKKYLTKEVKPSSNFNYQVIKGDKENGIEEGKKYLVIKCKTTLKGVYIYVVEKGSYKVKNIYRGTFKNKISTFAIEAGNGNIVFDTSKILYTKEILGIYNVTETGAVFTRAFDGKKINNPNFVNITTPNKYIDETGEANRVRIKFENDDTGKEKYRDKNKGLFDSSFNIANGHMRIYTVENSSKVQFDLDLTNWNGSAINKTITIEHMDEGILGSALGDKIIATQTINLSIPAFIVETNDTTIDISNPIVEYEKDDTFLGIVKVGTDGTKTLSSSGGDYSINNPWIKADNPAVYDGNILGKHRVLITSGANRYEGNTGSNGSSLTAILGAGEKNKLMWKYFGGTDKTTAFGVDEYDFIGGNYNVKIQHFNKDTNEIFKIYNYTVKLPAFDGSVYLDKTLEIGKIEKFEKEYEIFSAPNGKILLGSTGLKSLDRRITYTQNGGDGVSVRLLTQDVILKKEGTEYSLKGTLTIEDSGSIDNQVRGANREDTSARRGNVYLTLAPSEEEKLVSGGKYHILTAEGKEPLQIGVKADTGEFLKTVSELWLVTTEKYNKVNINFKNDGIPLTADKGWIDYIDGTISGYTGNWGEITGNREIPQDTTEIYLLDGMGRKIISGNSWTGEVPIGKSTVTVNFDGRNLKFGVKEGDYFVGEKGKFFLRYVDTTNNKYLKIDEVDVEFILNKLTSNATIRFLNPMMAEPEELFVGAWPRGTVSFGATTKGEVATDGNHSYTHSDAVQWWKVTNAHPYKTGEINYEVYNENGALLGNINIKNNFNVITPKQKVSYYISYYNFGDIELGIHSGYDGHRVNDVIYLVGKDNNGTVIRYEKINIEIDEFEPNAYGFLAPVENGVTVENKKEHIGTGIENLKEDVTENVLIDLGTNFRFYSRFKGIIECMQEKELDLQSVVDVIAKPVGDDTTVIKGKLKLVKGTENVTNIKMPETTNLAETARPKHYSLKFEVSPEEYKKLTIGTQYEIFKNDNDYHTLTIGLQNTSISPLRKNLKLDKALNFRTMGSSIEIKVQNDILDFGKININERTNGTNIIREGYTHVTVTGYGINDFSVTPNKNQQGETEIYLTNADGSQDITKKLQVSRLKAEEVYEEKNTEKLIRIYNLNGIVTAPKNSTVGEYTGQTVVNVTIIN